MWKKVLEDENAGGTDPADVLSERWAKVARPKNSSMIVAGRGGGVGGGVGKLQPCGGTKCCRSHVRYPKPSNKLGGTSATVGGTRKWGKAGPLGERWGENIAQHSNVGGCLKESTREDK